MSITEALVVPVEETEYSQRLELTMQRAIVSRLTWLVEDLSEQVQSFKGQKEFLEGQIKTESERIRTGIEANENLGQRIADLQSENNVLQAELMELKPKEPNTNPASWPEDVGLT